MFEKVPAWHNLAIAEVFSLLQTSENGLSYSKARQKLRQLARKKLNPIAAISYQFGLIITLIWFSDRSLVTIITILAVAMLRKLVATIIAKRIRKLSRTTAQISQSSLINVLRDQQWWQIPNQELIAGDLVSLSAGDRLKLDLRLFSVSQDLQINQTAIGGTIRTTKQVEPLDLKIAKLEQSNMLYGGCKVNQGEVLGVVVQAEQRASLLQIGTQQWQKKAQVLIVLILGISLILGKGIVWAIAICLILDPYLWTEQARLAQLLALETLQKFNIAVRTEIGVIDQLAQISLFCLMLDRPFDYAQPDSPGLSIHGILRGTPTEAEAVSSLADIPIYSNQESPLERIRLWQLQSQTVAVIADKAEEISLFDQADLSLCDRNCDSKLLENADLILPSQDFDLLAITILAARGMWQRMHQVIGFYAVSVIPFLAFSFLVDSSLWQILWLGIWVTPLLSWTVWAESPSLNLMALPVSYFRRLILVNDFFNLSLGIIAIAIPSLSLFYARYGNNSENLTLARTMALVSLIVGLILYTICTVRSPLSKNYLLITIISIIFISLFLLIKFDPSLTILSGWQWLTAILIGTCALWVQQFSRAI